MSERIKPLARRDLLRVSAASALAAIAAPHIVRAAPSRSLTFLIGSAPPDPACHVFYYAKLQGYFEQEGVAVEFKNFAAETTALRALVAGDGDMAWIGAMSTFQAINSGARIRCISAFTPRDDYLIVANSTVKDMKDMAGKSFAVSQIGNASQYIPILMFENAGIKASQLQWAAVGGSGARVQALVQKQVDATMLTSAFSAQALKYDYIKVLADAGKDMPNFIYALEIANQTAIRDKKDAIQAFVTATARAARWSQEHPEEAARLSEQVLPDVPKPQIDDAVKGLAEHRFFNPSALLPREAFEFTYSYLLKTGDVKAPLRYEDFYMPEFAVTAAAKLKATP